MLEHRRLRDSRIAYAVLVGAVTVGIFATGSSAKSAATLIVGDPAACTGATFTTIQSAVDAAASGDTVQVCDGTYTEQVVIPAGNDNLTLVGNSKSAVIKAPASMSGEKAIIQVAGAKGITIRGFTISGPGGGDCGTLRFGVQVVQGGSATVDSNDITAIRDEPLSGCQNGWAIGGGSGSDAGSVTATGNRIVGYQKSALLLKGAGSQDVVTGNTIIGAGPTSVIGQNAIQVGAGASATISGNTISASQYTPGTVSATGIVLYPNPGAVTVSKNTVTGADVDIWVYGSTSSTVTITGNTVTGGGTGIAVDGGSTGVQVTSNTTIGTATVGLLAGGDSHDNTFQGNRASGTPVGDGQYDCRDNTSGSKTAMTANTWTDNRGGTESPTGICSPPPVEVEVPPVVVLPTPPPLLPPPLLPPVLPPVVTAPAPPAKPPPGDRIVAEMEQKGLRSCTIKLVSSSPHKVVVARGFVKAPSAKGIGRLIVQLGVVPGGRQLLSNDFGGVLVAVQTTCITTQGAKRLNVQHSRAVLLIEHKVTPPGSWVPDTPILTEKGMRFLGSLRKQEFALTRIRCDGFTAMWPPSPVAAVPLSLERAQVSCRMLKKGATDAKARLVPHGHSYPIATNSTEPGRAENRRVSILFVHRLVRIR